MSAAKKNSLEQGISPISQEEFIRDFLPLPILHRGILFVLRTGYLIKQSPLEDLDVLGLCPTHTAEEEGALHVVLRRFFNRDASFWRSAAYDAIIQEELKPRPTTNFYQSSGRLKVNVRLRLVGKKMVLQAMLRA